MDKNNLWEELLFEVSNIEKIKARSKDEDTDIIIGSGNNNSELFFIGDEGDLYQADLLKVALGSTGEFLIKLCDLAEIYPELYYITTLTKSTVKYKDLFEEDQERLKELLHMQIALVNPKIIVALGEYSAECLLGRKVNFSKEKSQFISWKGDIKVLITYDVKYIKEARENTGKKSKIALDFWKDLQSIKKELDHLKTIPETQEV